MIRIVNTISNGRVIVGYMVEDISGKTYEISEDKAIELAKNYLIQNAKYNRQIDKLETIDTRLNRITDINKSLHGKNTKKPDKVDTDNLNRMAKNFENKCKLMGTKDRIKHLDDGGASLQEYDTDISNSNQLIIPQFIRKVNGKVFSGACYTHIYIDNDPNHTFSAKQLCRGMLSSEIVVEFKHPEMVVSMERMFDGCVNAQSITVKGGEFRELITTYGMFFNCSNLESINFNDINAPKLECTISMFDGCKSLNKLDISNTILGNVVNMGRMFSRCASLRTLDLSGMSLSRTISMTEAFNECKMLQSIVFNTDETTRLQRMTGTFFHCESLGHLDLSMIHSDNIINMDGAFVRCDSLRDLNLAHFDICENTSMEYMFGGIGTKLFKLSNDMNKRINK